MKNIFLPSMGRKTKYILIRSQWKYAYVSINKLEKGLDLYLLTCRETMIDCQVQRPCCTVMCKLAVKKTLYVHTDTQAIHTYGYITQKTNYKHPRLFILEVKVRRRKSGQVTRVIMVLYIQSFLFCIISSKVFFCHLKNIIKKIGNREEKPYDSSIPKSLGRQI